MKGSWSQKEGDFKIRVPHESFMEPKRSGIKD
ncbi:CTP synthetase [Bacillus sp. SG-1]|nr:CTP synthetase [Bacillus sp. SG-1]